MTCLQYAMQSTKPREEKEDILSLIINAMESAPVKDSNVPLNEAIRLIHKEYTYHRNTPLCTCLYLTTRKYLALYGSVGQEGNSEQLKNPEARVAEIRVAEHDRYGHFQLFRGGKVLLLCYQLPVLLWSVSEK